MHDPKTAPIELNGVGLALAEDLVIGAVPVLGEMSAIVLDYAFMRRVDTAARQGIPGAVAEAAWQGPCRPPGGSRLAVAKPFCRVGGIAGGALPG